jgi:hypothetical protein
MQECILLTAHGLQKDRTCLHVACEMGRLGAVRLLLQNRRKYFSDFHIKVGATLTTCQRHISENRGRVQMAQSRLASKEYGTSA